MQTAELESDIISISFKRLSANGLLTIYRIIKITRIPTSVKACIP